LQVFDANLLGFAECWAQRAEQVRMIDPTVDLRVHDANDLTHVGVLELGHDATDERRLGSVLALRCISRTTFFALIGESLAM
jgi:hypothetical protein